MADEKPWSPLRANVYSLIVRNPRSNRMLIEHLGLAADDETLDIGCGPGAAVRAAGRIVNRAVGVDASPPMIDIARRRSHDHHTEFVVAGAEHLPFPDDSFTVVWTVQSFHHWMDDVAGIGETRRVLKPGGRFHILETHGKGAHAISPAGVATLRSKLTNAAFTDITTDRLRKYVVITATN